MIENIDAKEVVIRIIEAVEKNKSWLSEIDGAIGDGDHGINMAKGFGLVRDKIDSVPNTLAELFKLIGMTLVSSIGGAMGPIYGTFFLRMGKSLEGRDSLGNEDISCMLNEALEGVKKRGGAELGDKTLVDTLEPAAKGFSLAFKEGKKTAEALDVMIEEAKKGMESTKELVAKKGRASRLGERSKGTIDAGSASCFIILKAMGEALKKYIGE